MRRDQREHAIRTACQIIGHREVIVVGSQAILGSIPEHELPAAATMSLEVDILPIADTNIETARLADVIEGVAGEFSPFGTSMDSASTVSISRRQSFPTGGGTGLSESVMRTRQRRQGRLSSPVGVSTRRTSALPSCAHSGRRIETSSPPLYGPTSWIGN